MSALLVMSWEQARAMEDRARMTVIAREIRRQHYLIYPGSVSQKWMQFTDLDNGRFLHDCLAFAGYYDHGTTNKKYIRHNTAWNVPDFLTGAEPICGWWDWDSHARQLVGISEDPEGL